MSSSSSSAYAFKPGGSLKLKGDDGKRDKKKKKKVKSSLSSDSKHASASTSRSHSSSKRSAADEAVDDDRLNDEADEGAPFVTASGRQMTEAERKFEETRRERMHQRIAKEARTSHKEKVDAFNKYLGSLSEHHDIPKVGPG
ncbi:Protein of unknown function DUF1754, eukaryotic [Kalmanozyma brasiliensis GHG001]|uniref:Protein of unknown function DUF1754, eukaryotic n=1 Tax=Kalmanozyma brasiliensis (strain GHG001) TaxID=1365824 RepID=UPI002867D38C|nr:Protein of unknown function DUF1754, eukaryotic [Kalmanozyma brasiliensis GHG001]KAF6766924.1 Protein of unknown function DUF1754, eukaryotic [Kalmanozyma brasiliensis GHG001]